MKIRRGKIIALATGGGVLAVVVLLGMYWRDVAALARFVYLFESIGRNEQGYPEYRHRQTGIVMVRVPGGTSLVGSSSQEKKWAFEQVATAGYTSRQRKSIQGILESEGPPRLVTLDPFRCREHG